MIARFILLSLLFVYSNGQMFCPDGWQNYDERCYKFFSDSLSWDDARSHCRDNSPFNVGHLATIRDFKENEFITFVVLNGERTRSWIGLNDKDEEGTFVWDSYNPEELSYFNWKRGGPSNSNKKKHCVEINRGGLGKWNDCKCRRPLPFVCQLEMIQMASVLREEEYSKKKVGSYPDIKKHHHPDIHVKSPGPMGPVPMDEGQVPSRGV